MLCPHAASPRRAIAVKHINLLSCFMEILPSGHEDFGGGLEQGSVIAMRVAMNVWHKGMGPEKTIHIPTLVIMSRTF